MLRLLSPQRDFLSAEHAIDICDAPRPCTTNQIEARNSVSTASSSHFTFLTTHSARSRTSSVTTCTSVSGAGFEIPRLTKTPWELERNKKNPVWRRSRPEYLFPAHVFKKLPREVYDCILEQLECLHFGQNQACSSCYLKDLYNLSLTSRAWDRAATLQLYRKVWVLTNEDHPKMPKLKIKGTSRLKLLRRTLRERQALARCVRELHMPDIQTLYQNAGIEKEEIVNLVASVVMACPNLERLDGFHAPFTHTFDRLSHALSTRESLKERMWILSEDDIESDSDEEDDPSNIYYHAALDPTERFLDLNSNHPNLTTLVLHQQSCASTPLTFRAVIGAFRQFPLLRCLSISNLPASSFTSMTLNALPLNLQSLRLENLPGINDKGLQRFATSNIPTTIENLTLIDLEISNLVTLSNFLSPHLTAIKRFTFSQQKAPNLPQDAPIPFLQSPTLNYLHWEIKSQAGPPSTLLSPFAPQAPTVRFPFPDSEPLCCLATNLLAMSIKTGLFPELKKVRIPHDPQGLVQALCKPRATALLPSDTALLTSPPRNSIISTPNQNENQSHTQNGGWNWNKIAAAVDPLASYHASSRPSSISKHPSQPPAPHSSSPRIDSPFPSPRFSKPHPNLDFPITTAASPAQSRLAAQARILASRKVPFMVFRVTDPKGAVRINKTVYGFLGTLDSGIVYEIKPDRNRARSFGVKDDSGWGAEGDGNGKIGSEWITSIDDVIGDREGFSGGSLGCRHFGRGGRKVVGVGEMF
ncbi:uncharacterized protein BDR25DRAFT_341529 [Lindgomyces ingoldianus]|uniref:Uncharacterized protein n=1 Tax=Lindgomyces ingoldianus TaxID=673940 RepID=A0ACB6R3Y4_9PLEO|nr:uncharacterized protein BDR25DRAFT_341529 [Lindgomyces ingoldianus]KAF2473485.1 hypothetical protein BDR25DRAFT_341529 [Lindgomyces ingoldianus]